MFGADAAALALAGLERAQPLRARLSAISGMGYRWVHLDASDPECRARELTRSARRDLAATLRRDEVRFAGLDLWIPAPHFIEPATADRAMAAALGAIELAAELAELAEGRAVVALTLPTGEEAAGVTEILAATAGDAGCVVADYASPEVEGGVSHEAIGVGFDPAGMMMARGLEVDLGRAVAACKGRLGDARLTDASEIGRVAPGAGRLDALSYTVALTAAGYTGPVVVDLRGVREAEDAAQRVIARV